MAGRVSIAGKEMELQEAVSFLQEQVEEARTLASQPLVEQLNKTFREALDVSTVADKPSYELVSSLPWFDGEKPESLSDFFVKLTNVGELSHWSDNELLRVGRLRLTGAALRFVQSENQERLVTFEDLKKLLTERFSDKAPQHCYFQQLSVIQQRKGESVEVFADRVKALNEKTIRVTDNAEVNKALREEADRRALDAFLRGLLGNVGEQTRLKFPVTLKEAVTTAVSIEFIIRPARTEFTDKKIYQTEVTCFKCHKKGHLSRDCRQRDSQPSKGEPVTCYRCGKKGHIRKDCRVRLDKPAVRPGNNSQSGNETGACATAYPAPQN